MINDYFCRSWSNFYANDDVTIWYKHLKFESHELTTIGKGNIHIFRCFFKNCTSSECGGAVRVTASATKILIESTDFSSCSSSNDFGGSLYLINAIDCIIYRICSVECSLIGAKSYGQFAYMCVCDTSSNKNIGVDLSISNSINDHDNACDLFYSRQGNVSISSMNASHNRCYYYSGYFSFPSVKNSEITGSLLFSSWLALFSFWFSVGILLFVPIDYI